MGGRAFLRRKGGEWAVVLCSGDALKAADALTRAAVPLATASELEKALASAEARLDRKIRCRARCSISRWCRSAKAA
ncbi:copper uptake system-associated protein [Bradyrhizobium diazoefficiens]|uniref:copper uptake system-associated protein n=1 Tax=Bradyrhizobium diazoefficiens TaxID=1355477 RepID=UPI00190A44F0|nr:copper uptake system-associated protein [Bradyrhizobium diazoefficiens]QQO12845.1 copper uptake system-associated protein [Bradyrhizobium diazoefficiens]